MSDGAFSDRLTQLRNRWEADPSSRVFLQLAEEYRHQGRIKEALAVLDRGLREHPGYLSALVAKGRCHLELGEPEAARGVLERVVKQDATQMVANKLLVRAYLDTGEADKARERLDLYSLLNDSDPEIEELRRRLRAMEQPPAPTSDRSFAEAVPPATGGDVFDLGFTPTAAPPRRGGDDLFALDAPAPRPAPAPAAAAPAAPAPAVAFAEAEEPEPEGVVFPGLGSRESRQPLSQRPGRRGAVRFGFEPPAPEPSLEATAPLSARVVEVGEERDVKDDRDDRDVRAEEAPVFELEETTPWAVEPAPLLSEPVAEPAPEPAATATLGEIYLRQGHLGEAKRIFDEVLRREPDNAGGAGRAGRSSPRGGRNGARSRGATCSPATSPGRRAERWRRRPARCSFSTAI